MAKWNFIFHDNSGYCKHFYIKAASKPEAIKKGIERATKNARGSITSWTCNMHSIL